MDAAGGNAAKSMGHVTLGDAPARAWSVSIGNGNSFRTRLVAEPVAADGRVYTIDTLARVRAFNIQTGAELWMHQVRGENSPNEALFGGGVTYDNGRVYATNGAGDAAALDAATGNQVWMVKPGGPLRGAPTVANDTVYALSQDSQLFALNAADGAPAERRGSFELAGVSSAPRRPSPSPLSRGSPRANYAYRYENGQWSGRTRWRDRISTSVGRLADSTPTVSQWPRLRVGQGGRHGRGRADYRPARREINICGLSTPGGVGLAGVRRHRQGAIARERALVGRFADSSCSFPRGRARRRPTA